MAAIYGDSPFTSLSDVRDELDASMEFGSGYLCVVGPPCSGKTTLVLEYLVSREKAFCLAHRAVDGQSKPKFCLEYMSARSVSTELLGCIVRNLDGSEGQRRRRLRYTCTSFTLGATLVRWLEQHEAGSELHVVVDDADTLSVDAEEINSWMSHCLAAEVSQTRLVCFWLISQLPLRLPNCFRYHFLAKPETSAVIQWLSRARDADGQPETGETDSFGVVQAEHPRIVSAQRTSEVVLEAVRYYASRKPMCATVTCKDTRLLLQRVYQLLPILMSEAYTDSGSLHVVGATGEPAPSKKLDARHFAAAWGLYREHRTAADGAGGGPVDPLVLALKRLSYSAVLLAFAAFYGGAVPKNKQYQVFGASTTEGGRLPPSSEAKGQSHKSQVLSASAHIISTHRLQALYEAMLPMCTAHIDPLEFTSGEIAMQYVQGFMTWGLLTPTLSKRRRAYHCWVSVTTAQQLGKELSLNLFDLIPN